MIDSKTKMLGLIGHPVEHSLSPIMHNAALRDKNLNYVYLAFDVLPENLKYVVDGLKSLGTVDGFNVTIPHKVNIMKYLDEIDREAEFIGAVNTVKIANNKAVGYNTDGLGARRSLEEEIGKVENKNILIVGAGGAARAVAFEFAKNNNLTIINRTVEKAELLSKEISEKLNKPIYYNNLDVDIDDFDIIIHTTPIGMYPNIEAKPIIDTDGIKDNMVVMDLIYNPKETILLKEAKKHGAKTINGLGMLVYQGAIAFEIWTGVKPDIDIMKRTLYNSLKY
ncbi:shikimate dehydrogenase [Methanothermococcus okinawensis]|uniref:Shikimate dehydrogenase (NADP(+)) n=1 Tax=Methanothermococcus okinawensis (strain DSM 14208 / JCM 11175 / IH1) TaxID=647113 RepID=F8AJY1_METOI|nr:shikimate dehydrogenase [Methanothermococcus okinawensis]AEH07337.1 Shikimate dehydrogenase [Methanothermococcus okinawensis IH1]